MALPLDSDLDFQQLAKILNLPDPSLPQHAATKAYVDAIKSGLDWKDSVRIASVGNVNVSSPGTTIDNVALSMVIEYYLKIRLHLLKMGFGYLMDHLVR